MFYLFISPNLQITKSKPTEGTLRCSYLRALFYAITGTLHFCLLPLLDLSHKSQGYVGDQNQILQLLATAPHLTSNLGQIQVLLRPQWLFSEVGLWSLSP